MQRCVAAALLLMSSLAFTGQAVAETPTALARLIRSGRPSVVCRTARASELARLGDAVRTVGAAHSAGAVGTPPVVELGAIGDQITEAAAAASDGSLRDKLFVVVGPSARELRELQLLEEQHGFKIEAYGELPRDTAQVDVRALIEGAVRTYQGQPIAGVIGSDDLGSFVASIVSQRLGLPGPSPNAMFESQNKFLSRQSQAGAVAADHVPDFRLVPLDAVQPPAMAFPFFMKPVRSHLSIGARQINNEHEFLEAVQQSARDLKQITRAYEDMRTGYTSAQLSSNHLIAESLITGDQVTVEAFIQNGEVQVLGVVDSVMYTGTRSFKRFDYPSRHPEVVTSKMKDVTALAVANSGLDNTVVNVEMAYDASKGSIQIIELNARMSSQFADLYEKVDGVNTYLLQLMLSAGQAPSVFRGGGEFKRATSFVMREFTDQHVVRVPTHADIARLRVTEPDVRVEVYGEPGGRLSDISQDTESYRWAIVNIGGNSEQHLQQRLEAVMQQLPFELRPVEGG